MLASRDSVIIVPSLKSDSGVAAIDAVNLTTARSYFTEAMDVGPYTELLAFCLLTGTAAGTLDIKPQYSPDKLHWVDSGDTFTQMTTTPGLFFKRFTAGFGKYMRLRIDTGGSTDYTITMHIAAKS